MSAEMNGALAALREWLDSPLVDGETKRELLAVRNDEREVYDRFYRRLSFGTGGLRGVLGAGTNRMNAYTVRQATQGLANYILKEGGEARGVAIAYDSRLFSAEFAREAALCLNANGIKTYRFESLRPTPELSFAVRECGCIAGIVITASHNPREYNGYKVYWEDGGQITPPHDKNIMAEVAKVGIFDAKTMPEHEARALGLYHVLGEEIDDRFMAAVMRESVHPEVVREMAEELTIVYTPLNGTGNVPVRRILRELGFKKVYTVAEQAAPDGNFPTTARPNPEEPEAFALALALAREKRADLVLATDPDADRLGVYARDAVSGEYKSFTGNMSGVLILEYLLREKKKLGTLPADAFAAETIVTTDMAKAVAAEYGVRLFETLTGFKYIGEQIRLFEESGAGEFVFGLEESYGCLAGTYARDKDSIVAVMLLAEIAAFYKQQGKTLIDAMEELYRKYGYYREGMSSLTRKGADGAEEIRQRMEAMRSNPPETLAGVRVLAVRDYLAGTVRDLTTGEVRPTGLPKSNVLYYELEGGAWCCARPSGTEPKIKFYEGVVGKDPGDAERRLRELAAALAV